MPGDNWERVQEIFLAAADLPEAEQSAFLEAACLEDGGLRAEVESLLRADTAPSIKLAAVIQSEAGALLQEAPRPDTRLGAYRLIREIGRGGMGAVYLAERDDSQFHKQVAIKVVKRGMDTVEILRRFRHERQILANLDHPYVARLHDGGATPDGRPFFVMEYVEGQPIGAFCRQPNLDIQARLRLFLRVCEAVSYAHRNLVVHRDLKPGNILVTVGRSVFPGRRGRRKGGLRVLPSRRRPGRRDCQKRSRQPRSAERSCDRAGAAGRIAVCGRWRRSVAAGSGLVAGMLEAALRLSPTVRINRITLCIAYETMARRLEGLSRLEEALARARAELEVAAALVAEQPDFRPARYRVMSGYELQSRLLAKLGRREAALATALEASRVMAAYPADGSANRYYIARACVSLGDVYAILAVGAPDPGADWREERNAFQQGRDEWRKLGSLEGPFDPPREAATAELRRAEAEQHLRDARE